MQTKFLKYLIGFLVGFIFLSPYNIFAACNTDGYSVIFVNGINTKSEKDTKDDTDLLRNEFGRHSILNGVQFLPGYNPSHLAGVADVVQTASQIFNNPISNYDLNTILLQIHPEVTTQKILLVGHSQGTFYTNELYDYLVAHGVPKEAIAVYNVATPASTVAGYEIVSDQGAYVTSKNDKVINLVRDLASKVNAKQPLSANITIPLTSQEAADPFGGHSFSEVYLAGDSVRIISDIESALKKLSTTEISNADDAGCFVPPTKDFSYYAQESVFSVADIAITGVIAASNGVATVGEVAYNGASRAIAGIMDATRGVVSIITSTIKDNAQISDQNLLAEVSLDNNMAQFNVQENIGPKLTSQSVRNADTVITETDSFYEFNKANETDESYKADKSNIEELIDTQEIISSTTQNNLINTTATTTSPQNMAVRACSFQTNKISTHQKLIINEVAWMGSSKSSNDEWIELKNISNSEIDISNWQILDKEEQIKFTISANTKISARGFFLLERTDDDSVPNVKADIIYTGALSNSDEGLRLFDDQCNLIDEVLAGSDWPAGDAAAKRTMERQSDLTWSTYSGTGEGGGDLLILGTPKKENSAKIISSAAGSVSGGGGGALAGSQQSTVDTNQQLYVKILINEIQINPVSNRFIELYNPNASSIDLTNWYIQRKTQTGTSFGSLVSKTYFENKTIAAHGYFLISREALTGADIVLDSLTITESNVIQLKNSNGDIVDKAGWGEANDCEGSCAAAISENQSIQRKIQNNEFIDTDNNANDFELTDCPNPKAEPKLCAVSGTNKSNQAPSAFFVFSPAEPKTDEIINFNAASSTDADGNIVSYNWDYSDGFLATSTQATTTHSYSLAGNYNISLTVFDNLNATSTYALSLSVASSSVQENSISQQTSLTQPNHILISEVMPSLGSGRSDEEFLELYNPTSEDISLTSFSLKRKSSVLGTTTQTLVKNADFASTTVKAGSFLLIASKEYRGSSTPDVLYSNSSYHLAHDDDAIVLYNASGAIVDEVDYQNINEGKSLERKALFNNVCISAQTDGEFLGNACDTDSLDDFEIREIPNPQNSNNFPEPRLEPVVNNFSGQYDKTNKKITLSWEGSHDYSGATSTLNYVISDISTIPSLSNIQTSSTTAEIIVSNFGKYDFQILAFDKEGLVSASSIVSVSASKVSVVDTNFLLYSQTKYGDGTSNSGQVFTPLADGILDSVKLMIWAGNGGWSEVYFSVYEWNGSATSTSAQSKGNLLAISGIQTISGTSYTDEIAWNFSGGNNILLEAGKYYYLEARRGSSSNGVSPIIYWKTSGADGLYLIINANRDGTISLQDPINHKIFNDQNISYKINYLEPFDGKYNSLRIDIGDFYTGEIINSQTISLSSDEQLIGWHEKLGNLNIGRHGYFRAIIYLSDSIKSESDISVLDVVPPEGKLLNQNYGDDGAGARSVSQIFRPMASGQVDSVTLAVSTSGNGWEIASLSIYEWNGDANSDPNSSKGNLLAKSDSINFSNDYSVGHLSETTWDFSGDNEIVLDSSKYYYLSLNIEDRPTDAVPTIWFGATNNGSLIDGRLIDGVNNDKDLYLVINQKS